MAQSNLGYPYISNYKKPQWYPYSLATIPDFYIPYYDLMMKYYEIVSDKILNYRNVNLENIYWYLILGKYLKIEIENLRYVDEIVRFIKKCEMKEEESYIGFKFSPFSNQKGPDTWSTSFALVILKILGKLNDYFSDPEEPQLKRKIRDFVISCKIKANYLHCKHKCQICKKTSEYKTLFAVLESILVLDGTSRSLENEILPTISKNTIGNNPKNLFRLLDLKFFSSFEGIQGNEIEYFSSFQRDDGGFNFSKPDGNINESFWIAYTFENYKYLAEYARGNLYPFILKKLKSIDLKNDINDSLKLMEYAKLVVILAFLWKNLIEDLETLIFSNLTKNSQMNINILSLQGGVKSAEYEIIAFINLKYNFQLNIIDNEQRFNQFQGRLDRLEQYFAKMIYNRAKQSVRFDITEIVDIYNKNKVKNAKVKPELVLKIVDRMISESFFKGKIVEKKKIFKHYYYFFRDEFIPKIITSNRTINFEDIIKEKRRLVDVREDIYNMTVEMKDSSINIMREVESLIFAEEVEYAEKRLKSNIKKALFDAEFFNKSIELSISAFEYIKVNEALKDVLQDWYRVYGGLQAGFEHVNLIMIEKIRESEKVQKQRDLLKDLETYVSQYISDMGLSFDMFKEAIRKRLEKRYSRDNVEKLEKELENLFDKIKEFDHNIIDYSQKINIDDNRIRKRRKKIIDNWISNKDDIEDAYSYYYEGFKEYHDKLQEIDSFYEKYIDEVKKLEEEINNLVIDRNFDSAYKILDEEFDNVLKTVQKESETFGKSINKMLKKKKKLFLLLVNLEKEWELQKKNLELSINEIRVDLRDKVEVDKNRQLREDFIRIVNAKIDFLDESIANLEIQMNKMLTERIPSNEIIEQQFLIINQHHDEANNAINEKLEICEKSIPLFRALVETYIIKWQKFQTSFEPRVASLKNSLTDDIIKKALITCTSRTNSNQIDLAKVAEELHMKKKIVRNHVEDMLTISKISGDIVEGTCYLVLYNRDWRVNKRLRLFIDGELNEIETITKRLKQLYEASVINSTFTNNIEEFREISNTFVEYKERTEMEIEKKINELLPNKNNDLFLKNMDYFNSQLKDYEKLTQLILLKADKSVKFTNFMNNQLESIKSIVDINIHHIEEDIDGRKNLLIERNKVWLKQEFLKIDNDIQAVVKNLRSKLNNIWHNIPESGDITSELSNVFDTKLGEILNDYNDLKEDLDQKLLNFEYQRVREELEKILVSKQDVLNNHLGRIQFSVEGKIEIKEFKVAMQKLHAKLSNIDEIIKKSEKELKHRNKKITSKSNVFTVKGKYLMDKWNMFLEEYRNIIREKQLDLELTILEKYIQMVIKVFKDEYIPFNYLSKEFNMKKDVVKERLISLIGENRLPGKIYAQLDVYYENDETVSKIDQASVELIQAANVQTYLFMNKLRRIASQFSPIVAVIASILTIIYSLSRIVGEGTFSGGNLTILLVVLFIIVIFLIWIRRGAKKVKNPKKT